MSLPFDICRCVSEECPEKLSCQRYVDRHTGMWTPFANLYEDILALDSGWCRCLYL